MKERKKEREGDGQTDREEEEKKFSKKKEGDGQTDREKRFSKKKKKKRGRRTDQQRRRRKKGKKKKRKKKKQLFNDATPASSLSFSFSPSFLFSFLTNETFRVLAWYPFTGQNSQISPIHCRYGQYFF